MPRHRLSPADWLAHYGVLFGTWVKTKAHRQDAEDAVHDAVIALLEGNSSSITHPRAYFKRAAENRLIDSHRRHSALKTVPLTQLEEAEHPCGSDPADDAHLSDLTRLVSTVLDELPINCRQVFYWNKIEGYTQEEIATKLGLSQSMVEKYMKQALTRLHDRLHDRLAR